MAVTRICRPVRYVTNNVQSWCIEFVRLRVCFPSVVLTSRSVLAFVRSMLLASTGQESSWHRLRKWVRYVDTWSIAVCSLTRSQTLGFCVGCPVGEPCGLCSACEDRVLGGPRRSSKHPRLVFSETNRASPCWDHAPGPNPNVNTNPNHNDRDVSIRRSSELAILPRITGYTINRVEVHTNSSRCDSLDHDMSSRTYAAVGGDVYDCVVEANSCAS